MASRTSSVSNYHTIWLCWRRAGGSYCPLPLSLWPEGRRNSEPHHACRVFISDPHPSRRSYSPRVRFRCRLPHSCSMLHQRWLLSLRWSSDVYCPISHSHRWRGTCFPDAFLSSPPPHTFTFSLGGVNNSLPFLGISPLLPLSATSTACTKFLERILGRDGLRSRGG